MDTSHRLLEQPAERLDAEYKTWLDLDQPRHQAILARAAIALANSGGGTIVLGFASGTHGLLSPCDQEAPADTRGTYTSERIQRCIAKYADPPFEVEVHYLQRAGNTVVHPIVEVPRSVAEPVVAARSDPDEASLKKGTLYMRRSGPETSPPRTAYDWRTLIEGIIQRRQEVGTKATVAGPGDPTMAPTQPPRLRTVRDRMSSVAPPPAPQSSPVPELDSSERYVFEHPISPARVERLREGIRQQLDTTMPMFTLTKLAGVRRRREVFDDALRFGLRRLSFKGPFVDGSNWIEVREREFALTIDEFLMKQFGELLVARLNAETIVARTSADIRRFVLEGSTKMRLSGGNPDLLVIVEPRTSDRIERVLLEDRLWWTEPRVLRGQPLRDLTFVHGAIHGLPTLQIFGLPDDVPPALFVVDMSDFELVLTNIAAEVDDYLGFNVEPVDERTARSMLDERPSLRTDLYRGKNHEDGAFSLEEAVLHLQLMAVYDLTVAGEMRERHVPRTIGARLGV